MSLEIVRLSQREKEQLQRVKRDTGIKNWNILCRWALCLSLAESTAPVLAEVPSDSNVEMTWKTFGGSDANVLYALVVQRHREDSLSDQGQHSLHNYFRAHLHRGIGYLFGDQRHRSLVQLVAVAVPSSCEG